MAVIEMVSKIERVDVTVPINDTVSSAGCLNGGLLIGIAFPVGIDSVAFTMSQCDTLGGTYSVLQYGGADLTLVSTAGKTTLVGQYDIMFEYLKIIMGTTETAARTITLIIKRME